MMTPSITQTLLSSWILALYIYIYIYILQILDAAALALALYIKCHKKKLKDVNCCSEITLHL